MPIQRKPRRTVAEQIRDARSLRPFDLVTWGVCERRGKTSAGDPMPHNNMGQRRAECAWCSVVATPEELNLASAQRLK